MLLCLLDSLSHRLEGEDVVSAIAARLETIIKSVTPDEEPAITFRLAPYHLPLDEQTPTGSPSETTRMFHVLPQPDARPHESWYACADSVQLVQTFRVEIRYQVPQWDYGWRRLHYLTASDVAAIHQKLLSTPSNTLWGSTTRIVTKADLPYSTQFPRLVDEASQLWILTIDYPIVYVLT